jgi:hypothetical protein
VNDHERIHTTRLLKGPMPQDKGEEGISSANMVPEKNNRNIMLAVCIGSEMTRKWYA